MLYQTNWEILPNNMQKVIMLIIHRKQSERGLSLGPFGLGINRESFELVNTQFLSKLHFFTLNPMTYHLHNYDLH